MGKKQARNKIDGWLILDKPSGITSAHAVAKVKRMLHPEKIGHAGTLDPMASGILPLALGEATKTVAYMVETEKHYSFTITWGQERDTDDSQGEVTQESDQRPSKEAILHAMLDFMGDIEQVPPHYSAISVNGQRAYDMARNGEEFELKPRNVRVFLLEMEAYSETGATFSCVCSKGTYIRSIARDLGRKLGCFGHVSMLRRLKVGCFDENHTISLEKLHELVHNSGNYKLWPVEAALDDILAWDLDPDRANIIKRGNFLTLPKYSDEDAPITLRARCDGKLIAICKCSKGLVKPVRVFNL